MDSSTTAVVVVVVDIVDSTTNTVVVDAVVVIVVVFNNGNNLDVRCLYSSLPLLLDDSIRRISLVALLSLVYKHKYSTGSRSDWKLNMFSASTLTRR